MTTGAAPAVDLGVAFECPDAPGHAGEAPPDA